MLSKELQPKTAFVFAGKQTYAVQNGMSALPPKADMCSAVVHVCFGPKADIKLLDHLIGAGEQSGGHCQAECRCGFQIDRQFVFVWRLHRQISRFLALEDAIDITGSAVIFVQLIGPVGD